MEVKDILVEKNLGTYKPNRYLSNVAIMHFEEPSFAHRRVFPICPVQLPSGHFYEFSKADLARDNLHLKPPHGTVAPATFGVSEQSYSAKVYQVIIGLDKIMTLPYQRDGFATERVRAQTIAEQMALHQEIDFAERFFNANAWTNVWTGATADNAAQKKFKQFNNADADPVKFFDERATEIRRNGRRRPNKIVMGIEAYSAVKNNPNVVDRIKYTGTTQNPAVINEQVLAQMFGVDEVIVLDATYNDAPQGSENMKFICDTKGILMLYAPDAPRIDAPSAGYIFTWLLDDGNYIGVNNYEGAPGTHTDILEGIIAYDMKKTSDDLAIYFADAVK